MGWTNWTVTGEKAGMRKYVRSGLSAEQARVVAKELVAAGYWVERFEV